jgi:hypothetical protein
LAITTISRPQYPEATVTAMLRISSKSYGWRL